jgi:hypothetical protein
LLTIRQDQIEILRRAATESYLQRLSGHLRDSYPALTEPEAREQAEAAVATAGRFKIHSENAVATFAGVVCDHCGGFPLGPLPEPVLATLEAVEISPSDRLRRFRNWFVDD